MPQGPAARITDNVMHPLPPVLTPGPGSLNTLIGFLPAWRGIPTAAAAGIMAAKQASDIVIQAAEAATLAAAGTPGAPAAYAAEQAAKAAALASMSSAIMSASAGADIHMCVTPAPVPPHGPGVVVDGSPTVLINNLPACRLGDTIIEPLGPPNKIMKGEFTVIIGQSGSGSGGSGSPGSPNPATAAVIVGRTAAVAGVNTGGGSMGAGAAPAGSGGSGGAAGGAGGGAASSGSAGAAPGGGTTGGAALAAAAKSGTPLLEECEQCNLEAASGPSQ